MGENKPRIVQIRRGTTAEHENFKGKIGEVTMDTDAKTLRIHDGQTPGGIILARRDEIQNEGGGTSLPENMDYVIESGGTSEAWYRKYKSGWVEQGGFLRNLTTGVVSITLPVPMVDDGYNIILGVYVNSTYGQILFARSITATNLNLKSNDGTITRAYWEVKGWMAT